MFLAISNNLAMSLQPLTFYDFKFCPNSCKTLATGQILKLTRDDSGLNERWEILPYELAVARRAPAAISMNTNNFRDTYKQDCSIEFQALAQKTGYQTRPLEFRK